MIINGIEMEMNKCIKNYVYLVGDRTRLVYYFDDDEKLNRIPEWEAVDLLKKGILTGMRREQYSSNTYLWYPTVQLDEIEKTAILTSQIPCSFKRIEQKIAYGRKTGSVRLPNKAYEKAWKPHNREGRLLNDGFDLERFITKIDLPVMERDVDNYNTKTFDFVRLHMYTLAYAENPMNTIKKYRKNILAMALDKIDQSKKFKRYDIPINFLKLDKITYCKSQNMIELLFVLKPIGGGLIELS